MENQGQAVQISMHKIPVGGSLGAAALIAILLLALAVELPGVRVAVWGGGLGVLLGLSRILWHRQQTRH